MENWLKMISYITFIHLNVYVFIQKSRQERLFILTELWECLMQYYHIKKKVENPVFDMILFQQNETVPNPRTCLHGPGNSCMSHVRGCKCIDPSRKGEPKVNNDEVIYF